VGRANRNDNNIQNPTNDRITVTMGGIEVNKTVIAPNKLIDKLDRAAARGSVFKSKAVAIADEFAPNVTPRVT
jgi:hypothetical protein